jgi:hypothetical protein
VVMELEFKRKTDGRWDSVPLEEMADKTLRECFEMWHEQEVIVKVKDGFICGTREWLEHYKRKGFKVISFPAAIETFESRGQDDVLSLVLARHGTLIHEVMGEGAKVIKTSLMDAEEVKGE